MINIKIFALWPCSKNLQVPNKPPGLILIKCVFIYYYLPLHKNSYCFRLTSGFIKTFVKEIYFYFLCKFFTKIIDISFH